jgi:hypothetical protein
VLSLALLHLAGLRSVHHTDLVKITGRSITQLEKSALKQLLQATSLQQS